MRSTNPRLRTAVAALTTIGTVLAAGSAQAVVVYSGLLFQSIPSTGTGLYVNVINGSTFSGPGSFPVLGGPGANFDFNLFSLGGWALFSPTTAGQSLPEVPTTSRGYVSVSPTGAAANLAPGTWIGDSSVFNTGIPSASALSSGQPVIIGFRFRNEGPDLSVSTDDTVHYGWMRVALRMNSPGELLDYAYESSPLTAIQAGAVPEPATWLLMGLGVAGLVLRRRWCQAGPVNTVSTPV